MVVDKCQNAGQLQEPHTPFMLRKDFSLWPSEENGRDHSIDSGSKNFQICSDSFQYVLSFRAIGRAYAQWFNDKCYSLNIFISVPLIDSCFRVISEKPLIPKVTDSCVIPKTVFL